MIERIINQESYKIDLSKHVQQKVEKTINKNERYPVYDLLSKEVLANTPIIKIPRQYFYGRQEEAEYTKRKKIMAISEFEKDSGYLDKNPVITCLVPAIHDNSSKLIIVDGHHRTRESGRFLDHNDKKVYNLIPTRVFSPKEMAEIYNASGLRLHGELYSQNLLNEQLLIEASIVEQQSERKVPQNKQPKPLIGITTIKQLFEKFEKVYNSPATTDQRVIYDSSL
jgi:hypothetical protein